MLLRSFAPEIILQVLEYVNYEERIDFIRCCRDWYQNLMRKFIRKLLIRNANDNSDELTRRIRNLLVNNFQQLSVRTYSIFNLHEMKTLLFNIDYTLYELFCRSEQFRELMESSERLRVKHLSIDQGHDSAANSYQSIIDSLAKVMDCESLSLFFRTVRKSDSIPYLATVKNLTIRSAGDFTESILPYTNVLHRLSLDNCSISEVSILGSIPYLKFKHCNQIVDISSLNDNDTVEIEYCGAICDYSHGFANTRKIKITLNATATVQFDLKYWKQVEDLSLLMLSFTESTTLFIHNNQLPKSLKKCHLGGSFVSAIDFTVTAEHKLNELKLSREKSVVCLTGYGLERVPIIDLRALMSLQSLEGLGSGRKNRKIRIGYCDKITDFSVLNEVPIVEIDSCHGFTNPLQVRSVRDLTIRQINELTFRSDLPGNPYENIHSLTILLSSYLNCDGLAQVPQLVLDQGGYFRLKQYLQGGFIPRNRSFERAELNEYGVTEARE